MSVNPQQIVLTKELSMELLVKYIEFSQFKGALKLVDTSLIKKSIDIIIHGQEYPGIDFAGAKSILNQCIHAIQEKGGVWKLNDASFLVDILSFINENINEPIGLNNSQVSQVSSEIKVDECAVDILSSPALDSDDEDFDLSELSKPVPIKIDV